MFGFLTSYEDYAQGVDGWVVLKTQQRREPLASRAVAARGVEAYVPKLPSRRTSGLSVPLFPGYLFAQIRHNTDDLLRIRSAPGIAYVLPRAGHPVVLSDSLIAAIRSREQECGAAEQSYARGDAVRVRTGPFRWVEGLFDRSLSAPGRVRILLDLVHGTAAVDLQEMDIEPVNASGYTSQLPREKNRYQVESVRT